MGDSSSLRNCPPICSSHPPSYSSSASVPSFTLTLFPLPRRVRCQSAVSRPFSFPLGPSTHEIELLRFPLPTWSATRSSLELCRKRHFVVNSPFWRTRWGQSSASPTPYLNILSGDYAFGHRDLIGEAYIYIFCQSQREYGTTNLIAWP